MPSGSWGTILTVLSPRLPCVESFGKLSLPDHLSVVPSLRLTHSADSPGGGVAPSVRLRAVVAVATPTTSKKSGRRDGLALLFSVVTESIRVMPGFLAPCRGFKARPSCEGRFGRKFLLPFARNLRFPLGY